MSGSENHFAFCGKPPVNAADYSLPAPGGSIERICVACVNCITKVESTSVYIYCE